MGRREENDGSRGRKSVSVESEVGVEEAGRLGGGGDGEREQGMIPEGCYRCSKISPHHSTN